MSANAGPIYNHRPMLPSAVRTNPTQGTPQLNRPSILESLDAIRKEYEALHTELNVVRDQRDELEIKLQSQVAELNSVRTALCELEVHNTRLREQYEEEFQRLQTEVQRLPEQSLRTSEPPLRRMGSPRNPERASNSQTPHTEPHGRSAVVACRLPSLSPSLSRIDHPKQPRTSEGESDRDRERLSDHRDPKRHRSSRRDYPDAGYPPPPMGSQVAGPSTYANAVPSPTNSLGLYRSLEHSSKASGEQAPPRKRPSNTDYTLDTVPPEFKKEGGDWHVVYNPKIKKALDVNLVHTFGHSTVVCCVQFSPDGRLLATGCDRTTQIFDVQTGAKICVLQDRAIPKQGDHYIRSIKFSPDNKLLATGAEDHNLRIWDIATRKILHVLRGHTEEIYSVDFSRDARYIVSGSADGSLRIWDTRSDSAREIKLPEDTGHEQGFTCVAISPDSTLVAGGTLDTTVRIYELATGAVVGMLVGHENSVYSVGWTPDGRAVISGSLDMDVKLWDVNTTLNRFAERKARQSPRGSAAGKDPHPLPEPAEPIQFAGHTDFVLSASITPDSRWIVSGSKDRSVAFWDARSADLQFILNGHTNSVISLHVNPLGGMLATGSGDTSARIWTYSSI